MPQLGYQSLLFCREPVHSGKGWRQNIVLGNCWTPGKKPPGNDSCPSWLNQRTAWVSLQESGQAGVKSIVSWSNHWISPTGITSQKTWKILSHSQTASTTLMASLMNCQMTTIEGLGGIFSYSSKRPESLEKIMSGPHWIRPDGLKKICARRRMRCQLNNLALNERLVLFMPLIQSHCRQSSSKNLFSKKMKEMHLCRIHSLH